MPKILATVDWFLNASTDYQAQEPTRRAELLALVERELEACQTDAERAPWEQRKMLLERP